MHHSAHSRTDANRHNSLADGNTESSRISGPPAAGLRKRELDDCESKSQIAWFDFIRMLQAKLAEPCAWRFVRRSQCRLPTWRNECPQPWRHRRGILRDRYEHPKPLSHYPLRHKDHNIRQASLPLTALSFDVVSQVSADSEHGRSQTCSPRFSSDILGAPNARYSETWRARANATKLDPLTAARQPGHFESLSSRQNNPNSADANGVVQPTVVALAAHRGNQIGRYTTPLGPTSTAR